jgi:hypothetical protein
LRNANDVFSQQIFGSLKKTPYLCSPYARIGVQGKLNLLIINNLTGDCIAKKKKWKTLR